MAEEVRDKTSIKGRRVYVLDTTAFIAKLPLYAPQDYEMYTTTLVLREVRDKDSLTGLNIILSVNRVQVIDPGEEYIRRMKTEAAKYGLHSVLSETDISVLALATRIKEETGREVVIVTDDYTVQNMAKLIGLEFMALRTRGIRRVSRYVAQCPACGYVSTIPGESECPICGTRLRKVLRKAHK